MSDWLALGRVAPKITVRLLPWDERALRARKVVMPYAEVGDIKLYYEVHGAGPPILLIPGLGADTRLFSKVVPLLATSRQVVVIDPRGGGQSDKPAGPYSIEQMADEVAELFGTLGVANADVVGYSMGGKIALQLAACRPELVDHLVLCATAASPAVTRRFSWRSFMMDLVSRIPLWRKVDGQPSHAFEAQRQASRSFDGRGLLPQVKAGTLIIRARRDRIVPATDAAELQKIPGSLLVDLPGGHLSLVIVHGKVLAEAISSFLSEV
ncbi:MAG TPA: alpha/beta hydrolase [Acidimicrobiales bacterium]|nr:alpha/beta hydrolase [Acidimicrobiales bacterium]